MVSAARQSPPKRMLGTSSRQAQTLTAERQQELPSRFWAAELPFVAAVEKQQVSLFSELPVEGSRENLHL